MDSHHRTTVLETERFLIIVTPLCLRDDYSKFNPLLELTLKRVVSALHLVIPMRFELMSSDRKSDILDHYTMGPYYAVIIKTILNI